MTYELILLRHGQSEWNLSNRFTGWTDVPLTEQGRSEAQAAGALLDEAEAAPGVVHTSLLNRAIVTANLTLEAMDRNWLPVTRHWRLNERHYGALQGLDKKETSQLHGPEQVFAWRRGYDTPPPPLELDDPRHPAHDERYRSLPSDVLPATECLADVVDRMLPYWQDRIVADLRRYGSVLVVAHGNSLRAMVKHLDDVSDDEIAEVNIPTGAPLRYRLDADLAVLERGYLGDADAIAAAAEAVARQAG